MWTEFVLDADAFRNAAFETSLIDLPLQNPDQESHWNQSRIFMRY